MTHRAANGGKTIMRESIQVETIKAAPAVSGAVLYGMTLNELVAVATLGYIILQAAYLIWKWVREVRNGNNS